MRLSDIQNRTATVTIEWFDETAEVTGYPGRITGDLMDALTNADTVADAEQAGVYSELTSVIQSWDIVDDHGQQLEVTAENAKLLPVSLLGDMLEAIQQAPRAEGKRSASGSRRKGR